MRTSHAGSGLCALLLAAGAVAAPTAPPAWGDALIDQWGLEAVGARDAWDAAEEQDEGRGRGATVAVVGTGVDAENPNLGGEVTVGTDFSGAGGDGADGSSTAVAAVAAATGYGVETHARFMGVAPDADVLSVRVAPEGGSAGEGDALERGIRYAADEGAQVIAVADGVAEGQDLDGVADAVSYAVGEGTMVLLPAGDPAAQAASASEGALAVGAVDRDLAPVQAGTEQAAQGQESPQGGGPDVSAPGDDVEAPAPGGGYERFGGAGVAAGFAAGAAALVRAEYPQLLPDQVAQALTASASDGVVNAPAAVQEAGGAAEDIPLYNEDLVQEDEGLPVPAWALWTVGGVLVLVLLVVLTLVLRRTAKNPYDLPRRGQAAGAEGAGDGAEGEPAAAGRSAGRRRKGAGRRRR
ncbi:S8 family serine peptidase [Nocardiopsis sp. RSe5-2]|uniref:S8 family serine peptidase n=1 Tax=Nocardiopsis endophytica TaxID=3018445 RepID=A0ABT4TYC1_9ACTN|nr:S8 family serine peptidase [Nocardiopsis endophytica]MDA2809696.1 S8 family serine peptidase [Nocardiopsis endophytica]